MIGRGDWNAYNNLLILLFLTLAQKIMSSESSKPNQEKTIDYPSKEFT